MAAETLPLKRIIPLMERHIESVNNSGKWPYVIENPDNPVVMTFIRHRDANIIESFNPQQMSNLNNIRLAILGSLRYGKPLVLDLADKPEEFDKCAEKINQVKNGLMANILDKSIIKDEVFRPLVKDDDGPEYKDQFAYLNDNFNFIIVSKTPDVPASLNGKVHLLQIV